MDVMACEREKEKPASTDIKVCEDEQFPTDIRVCDEEDPCKLASLALSVSPSSAPMAVGGTFTVSGGLKPYSATFSDGAVALQDGSDSIFVITSLPTCDEDGYASAEFIATDACGRTGSVTRRLAIPGASWCCSTPIAPFNGCNADLAIDWRFFCTPDHSYSSSGGISCNGGTYFNSYRYTIGDTLYIDNGECRRIFGTPIVCTSPANGGMPPPCSICVNDGVVACVGSRWLIDWKCT